MTKADLVDAVTERINNSSEWRWTKKEVDEVVGALLEEIKAELSRDGRVSLVGFGSFEVHERPERDGVDIKTGNKIRIAKSYVPTFKAGKTLKDAVKSALIEAHTKKKK